MRMENGPRMIWDGSTVACRTVLETGAGGRDARFGWLRLGWIIGLLSLVSGTPGCRPSSPETAGTSAGSGSAEVAGAGERSFQVRGVVREMPAGGETLVVRHEEIPGYMPKMTMELTVAEARELEGLSVGDAIEFRLVARREDHFIADIRRLGRAPEGEVPMAGLKDTAEEGQELAPGDAVPDVGLRLETGEEVRLSRWRGSAVAMTFIFTRCPLPDFCPRMNRNFQEARDLLLARGGGPTNWVFLSLSFDVEFDQPAVLRSYAGLYRGDKADGWWFGVLGPSGVAAVKPAFDLLVTREAGGYSHNLRTVVVDPEGRVFRQFDGNRWTAGELAEAVVAAAEARGGR